MEHPLTSVTEGDLPLSIKVATSDQELVEAKLIDDAAFGSHQGISLEELRAIRDHGQVILLRLQETGQLIGETQVLFEPISELPYSFSHPVGYCYGTAILPDFQNKGLGKRLAYYQEMAARDRDITELRLTTRVENSASLALRLGMGYEIYGYRADFYGPDPSQHSRLLLQKDLIRMPEVFPAKKACPDSILVPVDFSGNYNPATHSQIVSLLEQGYRGVAIGANGLYFAAQPRLHTKQH